MSACSEVNIHNSVYTGTVIGMYRIYIAVLHYGNTIVLYLILIVHLWDGPGI